MAETEDNILKLLKDIHPSAAAEWWPPAIGWWLLAAILLALGVWLLRKALAAWRRYRFRLHTEAAVKHIFSSYSQQSRQLLVELNQLLKRWLAYLGQSGGNLTGSDWAEFLLDSSVTPSVAERVEIELLTSAHYQAEVPELDTQILRDWALRWVRLQERRHG